MRERLVSLILLVILMFAGYRAEAADTPTPQGPVYLVPTQDERDYARQDNNRVRVNKIQQKVQEAAIEAGAEFGPPRSTVDPNVRAAEPAGGNWLFQQILGFVSDFVTKVLRYIFDILATHALALVHNPNVASPYDKDMVIGTNEHAKYDLLTPPLKKAVTKGFVVMRAIAVNLLLLLFILTIWKHFIDAAWKNGHELMGVVARLIATAGLIVFWPVISYHYVQISNEMIDYVFRSISFNDLALSLDTVSRAASRGAILFVFGTAFSFGVGALLGKFLAFFFFFPAIYQLVHLVVLKAIQTAIMLAQYMFAPMFLVFMATPDTEKIAIGFIKSCLEVSLWTFAWAGLFRLAVMILAYAPGDFWGTFIMLLGIFQIMLQVPDFIAHAQIGHSSSLLTPLAALRGFENMLTTLKGGAAKFRDYWNGKGRDKPNTDAGDLTNGKKLNTSGDGGAPPSASAQTPGPNPKGSPGAGPSLNAPGAADAKKREAQKRARDEALGRFGDLLGSGRVGEDYSQDQSTTSLVNPDEKGVRGINHGKGVERGSEAEAMGRAIGALAHMLETNPAAAAKLGAALGWAPNEFSGTDLKYQNRLFNQQRNKMATEGAKAWLNGEKGNAATKVLNEMLGNLTPEERQEMLESLMDPSLPHSPLNPNYKRNSQAVDGALLPRNPATTSYAASPEGSRLKGQALAAAYNALEQAMRPSLQAAGHTPGTPGYCQALGQAIRASTLERQKAVSAVGLGFAGVPQNEQPASPEEWEAWASETENFARTHGIPADQAFRQLRGILGTPEARNDNRPLTDKLNTAALALNAAREQRVPAYGTAANSALAGQLYELGRTNNLTPHAVYSATQANRAVGNSNLTAADSQLVDTMLNADPEIGGWLAGDLNEKNGAYNMALAQRCIAAGVGASKNACMRVVAAGTHPDLDRVVFPIAQSVVYDGMQPSRVGNGIAMVTNECMNLARSHLGAPSTPVDITNLANRLATGDVANLNEADTAFVAANQITPEDRLAYNDVATQGRAGGIHYSLAEVRHARALSAEGYGRTAEMATLMHNAVTTPMPGGGHIVPGQAAAGIRFMADHDFPRGASRDNPVILSTLGGMVASNDPRLGRSDWVDAAKYAAGGTILPEYTAEHIENLGDIAAVAGIPVRAIGHIQYASLVQAFPPDATGHIDVGAVTRQGVTNIVGTGITAAALPATVSAADRQVFMHRAAVLDTHREFSALSGTMHQTAVTLAGGWAEAMVAGSGGSADNYLQTMPEPIRRVIIAAAETGGGALAGLTGAPLVEYVRTVGTVAGYLGLRDYGQAVETVGGAYDLLLDVAQTRALPASGMGPGDPTRLRQELGAFGSDDVRTIVTIGRAGGTQARGNQLVELVAAVNAVGGGSAPIETVRAVIDMAQAHPDWVRGPEVGTILSRATEVSTPANLANAFDWMRFMTSDLGYNPRQIDARQIAACMEVQNITIGPNEPILPTRVLIERLFDAQINPQTEQDYVVVAARPEMAGLKGPALRNACTGVINYFNGTAAAPGRGHGLANEPRWTELSALAPNTIRSCIAVQQSLGAAQCADIAYVDNVDYNSSLSSTASGNPAHLTVRQGGAQFPIDYP